MEDKLIYNELDDVEQIGLAKMIADVYRQHFINMGIEVEFEELMVAAMVSLTPLTIYNVLVCNEEHWMIDETIT